MSILVRKPSTVEERSDAIVKKLEVLDQRLASKVTFVYFCWYGLIVRVTCTDIQCRNTLYCTYYFYSVREKYNNVFCDVKCWFNDELIYFRHSNLNLWSEVMELKYRYFFWLCASIFNLFQLKFLLTFFFEYSYKTGQFCSCWLVESVGNDLMMMQFVFLYSPTWFSEKLLQKWCLKFSTVYFIVKSKQAIIF